MNAPWRSALAGRRVLLTGHTGFKGGWLALWLADLGAEVTGFSLPAMAPPTFFAAARVDGLVRHVEGDIRDLEALRRVWRETRPEVVFHLAAQAIVRESYRDPLRTISTNTLGTANLLDMGRTETPPRAMVMVTSDKCYENQEWERGYHEDDRLGGRDIYSSSKAAAELLISAYRRSFLDGDGSAAIASARAGNVIGGGDWSVDRIVPDAIRALSAGDAVPLRNGEAVRPWQHVLEPLSGYLLLATRLLADGPARREAAAAWNFGPTVENTRTVRELVERVIREWGSGDWIDRSAPGAPHEATLLRLDIARAADGLDWRPRWNFDEAVAHTVQWYKAHCRGADVAAFSREQIARYEAAS